MEPSTERTQRELAAGTAVEVRVRFRENWSRGFQIAEATEVGYRLRRLSDNALLPVLFSGRDLRRAG